MSREGLQALQSSHPKMTAIWKLLVKAGHSEQEWSGERFQVPLPRRLWAPPEREEALPQHQKARSSRRMHVSQRGTQGTDRVSP